MFIRDITYNKLETILDSHIGEIHVSFLGQILPKVVGFLVRVVKENITLS